MSKRVEVSALGRAQTQQPSRAVARREVDKRLNGTKSEEIVLQEAKAARKLLQACRLDGAERHACPVGIPLFCNQRQPGDPSNLFRSCSSLKLRRRDRRKGRET